MCFTYPAGHFVESSCKFLCWNLECLAFSHYIATAPIINLILFESYKYDDIQ